MFIFMRKIIKGKLSLFLLGIILLFHAFVLTKLIYFPYTELFIYPYLTNHGLMPYSQILDQHFPGLMFLPVNFDNLGMTTPAAARLWSISVVVIVQIMLFLIGVKLFKSKTKALVTNLLFLIWQPFFEGWVLWIDSFLPLILLPAFYCLNRGDKGDKGNRGKKWFLIAGVMLGLGIVFKQTVIPLAIFAWIYILWTTRNFKTSLNFLGGLFIPVSLVTTYLIGIGVFKDFWYWTVTFNLTTYAQAGRGESPSLAHFTRVLLVFGLALLVIKKIKLKEARIVLIFLIGALLGLSTRFNFVHLQPALPFAILATVYGLEGLGKLKRLGVLSLYGLITIWWLIIFYKGHLGDRIISFDSATYKLADKIRDYTAPGEKIFVYGAAPHLYQMTKTIPAGNIFVFQFPWFLEVAKARILEGIIKDKPNIIVSDRVNKIEGQTVEEIFKRAKKQ